MSAAAGGKLGPRLVSAAAGTVRCHNEGGCVTVRLEGSLDQETAAALVDMLVRELATNPNRVDIDLCPVTSFVADGAEALARCRELCSAVPAGLHFRTEGGAGQLALLAAFESEPLVEFE